MIGTPLFADVFRIATYNTELHRDGPGLLLRDILKGEDSQIAALKTVVTEVDADVLVLQGIDYDFNLVALTALRDFFAEGGPNYTYLFARPPNTGIQTGLDLDGNGRLNEARDAQGYGEFYGQGAMAILSRYPLDEDKTQDFSALLWQNMPGAYLPTVDGGPFPSQDAHDVQRLSSVAHWSVPVVLPSGPLQIMTFHATPPVFDGPEDRNGLRNRDELLFWLRYLDGAIGNPPTERFVLLGSATIDPIDEDGLKDGINAVLNDPRLQDPAPMRPEGPLDDSPGHKGNPRLDTVAWDIPDPGHLRASYVLPSVDLTITNSGVFWPSQSDPLASIVREASRHRPVWVDLKLD